MLCTVFGFSPLAEMSMLLGFAALVLDVGRMLVVRSELQSAVDHREMGAIGERLAIAQATVDALEETWLALADEAEGLGLEL